MSALGSGIAIESAPSPDQAQRAERTWKASLEIEQNDFFRLHRDTRHRNIGGQGANVAVSIFSAQIANGRTRILGDDTIDGGHMHRAPNRQHAIWWVVGVDHYCDAITAT